MIIISNVTYPPERAGDIAKRFLQAPPLPGYIKKNGPYIAANNTDGIQSITFYELDNANLAKGIKEIGESLAIYIGVPGYKYDIKVYFEIEEGLTMIGL